MNDSENTHPEIDLLSIERDIEETAPLFNRIFDGPAFAPPASIAEEIYAEADRARLRRRFQHKLHSVLRVSAAAAAMILVMAGAMRINTVQQNNRRIEVLNQLCIVSSEDGAIKETSETSTATLADMLLEMQGLDAETYFAVN